jgi:hypothetical protein
MAAPYTESPPAYYAETDTVSVSPPTILEQVELHLRILNENQRRLEREFVDLNCQISILETTLKTIKNGTLAI